MKAAQRLEVQPLAAGGDLGGVTVGRGLFGADFGVYLVHSMMPSENWGETSESAPR